MWATPVSSASLLLLKNISCDILELFQLIDELKYSHLKSHAMFIVLP